MSANEYNFIHAKIYKLQKLRFACYQKLVTSPKSINFKFTNKFVGFRKREASLNFEENQEEKAENG